MRDPEHDPLKYGPEPSYTVPGFIAIPLMLLGIAALIAVIALYRR
jgi:hypothetical protein